MYLIAFFFLGILFKTFIGTEAVDFVKLFRGADWAVGSIDGAGEVVLQNGIKMLQIPLWRSFLAGCILLGIAPCTAMVLVWRYLARGNDGSPKSWYVAGEEWVGIRCSGGIGRASRERQT